ncbi:hypothetical protein ACM9XA_03540 [Xanthomonas sacchari]
MERKCEKCAGLGGERWNYPDGSEAGIRCDECDGFGYVEDGNVNKTILWARNFVSEAMMENGDPGFASAVIKGGYDNGTSVKAVCKALAALDQLRTEKKEFAQEAVRWAEEAGRLKALLHDAQRDAERYRWLRSFEVDSYLACGSKERLDSQIDAAMAAEREGQG